MFEPISIYLHIPFCHTRCSYCAFNTYTGLDDLIEPYVEALCTEIDMVARLGDRQMVHTVYFGGGTPSMLTGEQVVRITDAIKAAFDVTPDCEITMEANPVVFEPGHYDLLHQAGVNRLSFGAQSSDPAMLRLFNRDHDWAAVEAAVRAARHHGFKRLSLDLIYGVPGQTKAMWAQSLRDVLRLDPGHVSAYSLGIEPKTAMGVWVAQGIVAEPDGDLAADMYEAAGDILAGHGYEQYEISNWAVPGQACTHNLQYWRNLPYLGFGAGAYGYADGKRYAVIDSPWQYVRLMKAARAKQPDGVGVFPFSVAVNPETVEAVDESQARAETMMLGLRLLQEGVSRQAFEARFGMPLEHFYGSEMTHLENEGLLAVLPDRLRITPQARMISNYVYKHFV